MATKPEKLPDEYKIRNVAYGENSEINYIDDNEMIRGRNNVGEEETPLGSVTNAHKDNYLFCYITKNLIYLSQMIEYLEAEITELKEGGT